MVCPRQAEAPTLFHEEADVRPSSSSQLIGWLMACDGGLTISDPLVHGINVTGHRDYTQHGDAYIRSLNAGVPPSPSRIGQTVWRYRALTFDALAGRPSSTRRLRCPGPCPLAASTCPRRSCSVVPRCLSAGRSRRFVVVVILVVISSSSVTPTSPSSPNRFGPAIGPHAFPLAVHLQLTVRL